MSKMTSSRCARGALAVRANRNGNPQAIFEDLQAAFTDFRGRYDGRVDDIQAGMDGIAADVAALKVGGAGGGNDHDTRSVHASLGRFARTGVADVPSAGLGGGAGVQASMRSDSDPDGGYTVSRQLADSIVKVQRDDSAMRRLARVVNTRSNSFGQPVSLGGTGSGWVGERAARPEKDASSLAMVEIASGEVYANPAITQGLLDDSEYNIGEYIVGEIADSFNDQEGDAFINGDGVNKPRGFLTKTITNEVDSARAFGTLQYTASGGAAGFASSDPGDALITLKNTLKAKHRRNAAWLMNSNTMSTIEKFKDGQGNYLWRRSMSAGTPDTLLGYPVENDEDMPDVAAGAYPIAFGDWMRGYLITDRVGTRVLRDPYTNKPYVMFYATKRVGGGVVDSNAIKLLQVAAS